MIMMSAANLLLFSLLLFGKANSEFFRGNYWENNCTSLHHNKAAVKKSCESATKLLSNSGDIGSRSDTLAVMILFSKGFHTSNRLKFLRCSLLKLKNHLMTTTKADVYIWTLKLSAPSVEKLIPSWFNSKDFPRMHIMEIDPETWMPPCGLKDKSHWAAQHEFDYYLMGRWRLTFSLDFARAMGYKYHLQIDDDAWLEKPIPYDLVQKMEESRVNQKIHQNVTEVPHSKAHSTFPHGNFDENNDVLGYHMGVYRKTIHDTPVVLQGLPELTGFWLRLNRFTPRGALIDNLKPNSLQTGLYSAFDSKSGGWSRKCHLGYFIVINLDYWYLLEVQDYLTTVLRSGGDVEGRWQEQGVMNMMLQVFIPTDKLLVFDAVDIVHNKHNKEVFEASCVKTGLVNDQYV